VYFLVPRGFDYETPLINNFDIVLTLPFCNKWLMDLKSAFVLLIELGVGVITANVIFGS